MINAKEIRIGNLVEYRITDKLDERKEWWEVSEIDADDIHWLSKVDTKDEDFRAIPITEEWLLKFDFKRFPWGLVKDNLLFKDDLKCSYLILQVGNGFEVKVKYVHELQNLYFALTGSELTVA